MASNSLRSAYNTVRDARQVLEEREAEDRRVHDEMRTKMLEDVVTKQNPGQPVDQVIAHQLAQMQLTNPVAANYLGYLNQIQPIQPQQQMQVQQWPSNANAPPPYFNND
ncbi:hypothetical protein CABS01_06774 [Colletotrichum abscissum]|uniref:Uncharacterized protein n=1 Tax=Colletotrichum abscissum TaxID=1671311 RepID=A0A9P9X7Y7_9PEZI|nr:uncharacterized protein CABS01_06774 [Colletotrichum abscissum]KAI3540887.1 hypothetical protein CABS02_10912 [Colletotrichum abscissum]KAK1514795.1 hypothetical protein CABS01_06774 [Colletotrichum abscissum]